MIEDYNYNYIKKEDYNYKIISTIIVDHQLQPILQKVIKEF